MVARPLRLVSLNWKQEVSSGRALILETDLDTHICNTTFSASASNHEDKHSPAAVSRMASIASSRLTE